MEHRRRAAARAARQALAVALTAVVALAGMAGIAAAKAPTHHPGRGRAAAPSPFGSKTQLARSASGAPCTIGQVLLTAGIFANGVPANGQVLSISSNIELYSMIGNVFGGTLANGTFVLPELNASAPNGMTYSVCTKGVWPDATDDPIGNRPNGPTTPLAPNSAAFGVDTQRAGSGTTSQSCVLGQLLLTAGVRGNGIPANGQLLPVASYPGLFELVGYTFGGSGTQFALPQMQDAAPSGLTYSVCAHGLYPQRLGRPAPGHRARLHRSRPGAGSSPFGTNTQTAVAGKARGAQCTLGDVSLYAGQTVNGTPADGQQLELSQNQALYALIGYAYGGSAPTWFALPKLALAAPNGTTYAICTNGQFPAPSAAPGSGRPGDRDGHHGRRRDDDRPGRR